jgi:hypothetical protein
MPTTYISARWPSPANRVRREWVGVLAWTGGSVVNDDWICASREQAESAALHALNGRVRGGRGYINEVIPESIRPHQISVRAFRRWALVTKWRDA